MNVVNEFLRFYESKDRLIDKLPALNTDKDQWKEFFKTHSNLENQIDWQNKNLENTIKDIKDLIKNTYSNKESKKSININAIDFERHGLYKVGEDDNYLYLVLTSYEAAQFCDSAQCGGQGAKWCIGTKDNKYYWNKYTYGENALFIMALSKGPAEWNERKYMVQINNWGKLYVEALFNQEDEQLDLEDFNEDAIPERPIVITTEMKIDAADLLNQHLVALPEIGCDEADTFYKCYLFEYFPSFRVDSSWYDAIEEKLKNPQNDFEKEKVDEILEIIEDVNNELYQGIVESLYESSYTQEEIDDAIENVKLIDYYSYSDELFSNNYLNKLAKNTLELLVGSDLDFMYE